MKRELDHFRIGSSYGGNQDWFRTFMMRIGGCGAETACDSSLYFAICRGIEGIYPFDLKRLSKHDYVDFAHMMEEYLWPRWTGIDKLGIFVDGYSKYLEDRGVTCISMDTLDGREPYEKAVATVILNHRDRALRDYVWHWFLINGYERPDQSSEAPQANGIDRAGDTLRVKAVTYSGYRWLDLGRLWDTGFDHKGGLILFELDQ